MNLQKKRYKSKDSERNRRNRINERLQELKGLLPNKSTGRDLTKEEILAETIDYIHNLHGILNFKPSSTGKFNREESNGSEISSSSSSVTSSPISRSKPRKRSRLLMIMLFTIGVGLFVFPIINPPQNHPLFSGKRLPRHHSRIWADAGRFNSTCDALFFYDQENVRNSFPYTEITPYPTNYNCQGLSCSAINNQCLMPYQCINNRCEVVKEGDRCRIREDCGFWMECIRGHCQPIRFAGEKCNNDYQCYSHDCRSGICGGKVKSKLCSPRSPNQWYAWMDEYRLMNG